MKESIEKVSLTKYWNPLAKRYYAIPFSKKVTIDLEHYITTEAIQGLFILVKSLIFNYEFKNFITTYLTRITEMKILLSEMKNQHLEITIS